MLNTHTATRPKGLPKKKRDLTQDQARSEKNLHTTDDTPARALRQADRDQRLETAIQRAGNLFLRNWTRTSWNRLRRLILSRSPEYVARREGERLARIKGRL